MENENNELKDKYELVLRTSRCTLVSEDKEVASVFNEKYKSSMLDRNASTYLMHSYAEVLIKNIQATTFDVPVKAIYNMDANVVEVTYNSTPVAGIRLHQTVKDVSDASIECTKMHLSGYSTNYSIKCNLYSLHISSIIEGLKSNISWITNESIEKIMADELFALVVRNKHLEIHGRTIGYRSESYGFIELMSIDRAHRNGVVAYTCDGEERISIVDYSNKDNILDFIHKKLKPELELMIEAVDTFLELLRILSFTYNGNIEVATSCKDGLTAKDTNLGRNLLYFNDDEFVIFGVHVSIKSQDKLSLIAMLANPV